MMLWLFHIKDRAHLENLSSKLDCGDCLYEVEWSEALTPLWVQRIATKYQLAICALFKNVLFGNMEILIFYLCL